MNKRTIGMICGGIIITFIIILIIASATSNTNITDNNTNSKDPFDGKNARLENITITESYGTFPINGKIMFKHDESYASLSADVNLKDGSKISESIVKNWNDVSKNQWYRFDGCLFSASGGNYSLSDIISVDFKYDDKVIYTWENNS